MKKHQILATSVEQTAECYPIIKKFAKGNPYKLDILMKFNTIFFLPSAPSKQFPTKFHWQYPHVCTRNQVMRLHEHLTYQKFNCSI